MPISHSCFISYRHGQHELMMRFVEQLHEALASELEALTDLKIYRDTLRLQGGDFYNAALARSLCESVCMVMIFTPTYFSPEHRYCAREFAAMSALEKSRPHVGTEHGLIIPVVLRGFDELPVIIRSNRQVYRFERYSVSGPKLIRNRRFDAEIQRMAQYIAARVHELRDDAFDCSGFDIPGEGDVNELLGEMASRPAAFPGRERERCE
jgi:hypothetical protein